MVAIFEIQNVLELLGLIAANCLTPCPPSWNSLTCSSKYFERQGKTTPWYK